MEDSEEEERAENSRRERWTKVEQLSREDKATMERHNAADFATLEHGREPKSATRCVSVFPQDQAEDGTSRLVRVQRVKKLVRHLKPLDIG